MTQHILPFVYGVCTGIFLYYVLPYVSWRLQCRGEIRYLKRFVSDYPILRQSASIVLKSRNIAHLKCTVFCLTSAETVLGTKTAVERWLQSPNPKFQQKMPAELISSWEGTIKLNDYVQLVVSHKKS